MCLVSKEVDLLELREIDQSEAEGLVPTFREHIKADLATCGRVHSFTVYIEGSFSQNREKPGSAKFHGFCEYVACLVLRLVTNTVSRGVFFTNAD